VCTGFVRHWRSPYPGNRRDGSPRKGLRCPPSASSTRCLDRPVRLCCCLLGAQLSSVLRRRRRVCTPQPAACLQTLTNVAPAMEEQGCHHAPGKRLLSATMRRRSCSCWLCSSGDGGPGGGARVRMVERERRAALRRCAASRSGGGGGCVLPATTCTHHNNSPASSLQGGRSISTRPPAASLNCAALGWPGTRVCTPALCLPGQQPSHPARLANCRTLPGQDASSARPQSGMPPRRPTCCGARGGRALDQRAPRFAACSRVGEPFHWVAGRLRSTRVDHGHARDGMLWGWLWRRYEHPPVTERQARGCETDALPLMG
jgi:hypothetical protein